jgi:uncharacterized repeat protein (TIGR03803 family)
MFYGVANGGGLASNGAIFRADLSGNITTIHSFSSSATDGSDPETNFFLGNDGFFYGTASQGGLPFDDFRKSGVVYRADTAGRLWILHTFIGDDGANPVAAPVLDRSGRFLFATAIFQGPLDHGTLSRITLRQSIPIADLTFSPNPVKGGQPSTATVTLARPAGPSGQSIKLTPDGNLTIPQSVTVPAGQTSVTFQVNSQPVTSQFGASITASISSLGISSTLTVTP